MQMFFTSRAAVWSGDAFVKFLSISFFSFLLPVCFYPKIDAVCHYNVAIFEEGFDL